MRKRNLSVGRLRRAPKPPRRRPRKRRVIDLERLRAAWEATGLTWHQLAKRAGMKHSVLSRLNSARGPSRAVNAPTLRKIAQALQMPEDWLTGERRDLPFVPERDLVTRSANDPTFWERPTAEVIRWSWLLQRVQSAMQRDLGEWLGDEQGRAAYDSWGHGLLRVFAEMGNFASWRMTCLATPGGNRHILPAEDAPAVGWLLHLFEPWLAGTAKLDADATRAIFEMLRRNPGRTWGSESRDANGIEALQEYARACEGAMARQLEGLGPEGS